MIEVDESKLVDVIEDAMCGAFRLRVMDTLSVPNYFYKIIQENYLDMDDKDLDKLFGAVQQYLNDNEAKIRGAYD